MARMPPGGDYGGGYLKVQRHLRTAVISMGFALVTTTPFTANLTVPSISQAQLTGYKYPARTVRQTEPQQGWLYTGSLPFDPTITGAPIEQSQLEGYRAPRRTVRQTDPQPIYDLRGTYSPALANQSIRPAKKPWRGQTEFQDGWLYTAATPAFDPTVTVAPVEQSQLDGFRFPRLTVRQTEFQNGWLETATHEWSVERTPYSLDQRMPDRAARKYRYADYPSTDWIYQSLPVVWDASQFQNISGDLTPIRAALKFRYPLASSGFATDGSNPAAWDASQFQNNSGDRTPARVALKYRYDDYPQPVWISQTVEVWSEAKFQNANGDRTPASPSRRYRYDGYPATDWIYQSLPVVWDASQFQNISGDITPIRAALRYRYADYPNTDWIYQNLPVADVWDESKFQNNSGDLTPIRPALKFRYPLASSGFSTDGSSPPAVDVWSLEKFQNIIGERTAERRQYDPRYEFHKFSFGLLDARVVMPAIDQLANSERAAPRKGTPIVTPDSLGWLYQNIPVPFDPQYLVHSSDDRLRERYKKVPQLDQPAQDWIFTAVPPFDPQYLIQISAPDRMADRRKQDVVRIQFYNDMAWLRDVLGLPDPPAQANVIKRRLTIMGAGY